MIPFCHLYSSRKHIIVMQIKSLSVRLNCRILLVCCFVITVTSYFFLTANFRQYQNVVCSNIGTRNFIPEWTKTLNKNITSPDHRVLFTNGSVGDEYSVPNIVHYIWYAKEPKQFKFHHMLSVLSVQKHLKPQSIYFHTNRAPVGEYWDKVKDIPTLQIVHRQPSQCLFDEALKKPYYETSESNVDRLRVLFETGGIYLDLDVIAIQSFDDLRKYPCTVGLETETRACGGIIVSRKEAFFLTLWINSFLDDYKSDVWAYNTGLVPFKLWKRFPYLVHIEKDRLHRPSFKELEQIYGSKTVEWNKKYAIHLWYRVWKKSKLFKTEPDPQNIKTWNSTFGQIARHILYGKSDMMS